jgi:hypothetical protein
LYEKRFIFFFQIKLSHNGSRKKECSICGVLCSKKYLSEHIKTDHEGKDYPCTYCGIELTSKGGRDLHEQKCKNETKEENELPPRGSTMFMEGFKDGTTREDINEALKLQCDVEVEFKAFVCERKNFCTC